jgi:hypothetical protein
MSVKAVGDNNRGPADAQGASTKRTEIPGRRATTNEYFAIVAVFVTSDPNYVNIADIKISPGICVGAWRR